MMYKTKFQLLALCGILFLFACAETKNTDTETAGEIPTDDRGLKDVADFPVGTAVSIRFLPRDTQLQQLIFDNFNSITAENDMKMRSIARSREDFNFEPADRMVEYAEAHDMRLFGHALIWHSSTPDWLPALAEDPAELDAFMKDYIHTYVGRYKGKVAGWDVVNEAMNTAGGEYRETLWYKALGKDYIAKAFTYAHEADPEAILFYNDFNIERDTAKLHGTLRMIEDLKAQGVPISGLGFQMHIRMDIPNETIAYALKKGAETGLKIHLSEVDIIFNKHDDTQGGGIQVYDEITPELLKEQGEKYKELVRMYRTIVPKEQQFGITFWGVSDRYTWVNGFFGLKDKPTIFDEQHEPKPAYYGFKEGLMMKVE
jgi:endo-1,4-beta-xylanase